MASDIQILSNQQNKSITADICNEQVRIHAEEGSTGLVELTLEGEVDILVHVHSNAVLTIRCIQTKEATVTQKAHLAEGASINCENISLAPANHQLTSIAEGPHACSDVKWVFFAKDSEQQTLSARNVFHAEDGAGEIILKGIAQDTAHVTCNGLIDIGLKGGGTNTYLTEDVLMLDSTAKVDAIPGLEIKTNDVKASHSATVSKVTPEDLFYFASRGIGQSQARQMYIVGFLGDLVQSHEMQKAIDCKYQSAEC